MPLFSIAWLASAAVPDFGAHPATPTVRGATPEELVMARRLYAAAAKCTGWEPSFTHVEVGFTDLPTDLGGLASPVGTDGYRLLIDEEDHSSLPHEVAHLWFHGGHDALTEGRAEVLGRCAIRVDPVFPAYIGAITEARLDDLRTWRYDAGRFKAADGPYYVGSRLLLSAISEVIGPEPLLGTDAVSWDTIVAALRAKGEAGSRIAALIEQGPAGQHELLSNTDRDDWPLVLELARGTDPVRWDTDGDGWWDGAAGVPEGAAILFADGMFTCLPKMALADGNVLTVHRRDTEGAIVETRYVLRDWTYMLAFPEGFPNAWVVAGEGRWGLNDQCGSNQYATVKVPKWEDKASAATVAPLLAALPNAWSEASLRLGDVPSPRRLRIEVGGDKTYVVNNGARPTVRVSTSALHAARKDWTLPGKLAIAAQVVAESGRPFAVYPGAVDAFAQWLFPSIGKKTYFTEDASDVRLWTETAAACPTGWKGLLDGSCH